jgi:carboxyl-terminal processing protease
MKTLVLDMRYNPGGLLEQGVEAADLFLDRGQEIVSMRGRAFGTTRDFNDSAKQHWPDLSMIVLVNEGSASAAEIVAGALQDHDRAVIIGATTFGKGSAQSVFAMPGGGALKLTTARWYTPVGRSIQKASSDSTAEGEQQDQERLTVSDTAAEVPLRDRIPFRTDGGRTVYGGGGITPDLIVTDMERAEAELEFERALGTNIPRFRDALTEYALSLKTSKGLASPSFAVTERMREDLWRLLEKRGVTMDRETYEGADSLVSRLMSYEIARYVFGPEAEFQQRMRHDAVVKTALDLARGAESQRDLLARAATRRAANREDVSTTP